MLKVLRVRIKDKHSKILNQMAFETNQIWNLANEISYEAWHVPVPEVGYIKGEWLSNFDIQKKLAGIRAERNYVVTSKVIQETVKRHAENRTQFKKSKLRWRISSGPRRSLGWVPFHAESCKWRDGRIKFAGHYFDVWDSYGLDQYEFRAGSFSEDARGRWYFNVAVEYQPTPSKGKSSVGIDLGLKDVAVCSDGERLTAERHYRTLEEKLGKAQRANKKHRVKSIHAKIKNRRKDQLHKFSTRLVEKHGAIFVGNVSSSGLAKTKMAKSVLDAGWSMLRTQLKYKAIARSVVFEEIDEAYTTQACSCCGVIGDSSPKGRAGLGIREWACASCGTLHDRDENAARNILALGCERLAGGSSVEQAPTAGRGATRHTKGAINA